MKKFFNILLSLMLIISLTACSGETQPNPDNTPEPTPIPTVEKIETVVEITEENFYDYFKIVKIENPIDQFGDPFSDLWECYIITSNVYDDGLVLYKENDVAIEINNGIHSGSFIQGVTVEPGKVPNIGRIKGTVTFVNSDFVKEYSLNNLIRDVKFIDGTGVGSGYSTGWFFNEEYPY